MDKPLLRRCIEKALRHSPIKGLCRKWSGLRDFFSAEKPRRLRCAAGTPPRAAFQVPHQKNMAIPSPLREQNRHVALYVTVDTISRKGAIGSIVLQMKGYATRFKEPLNKSSSAEQRIFCPIRAVQKTGNTSSIPVLFELSPVTKSLAVSSCRFNQRFLNSATREMAVDINIK